MDDWKYVYVEDEIDTNYTEPAPSFKSYPSFQSDGEVDANAGLNKKRGAEWEANFELPPPLQYKMHSKLPDPCDEDHPRLYHMFWTGPFTDKPYLALLSFLYTQNVGLHLEKPDPTVCRPKFWLWINPGPAASVPNPNALRDMFDQLKSSPWASPFLHPRFKDVIQFKLWNTTEQLDGVPELKDEWRKMKETLFNSGGHIINVPNKRIESSSSSKSPDSTQSGEETVGEGASATHDGKEAEDDILNRTGSKSSSSYDRLSVILSDMARFVLCHRFGGIYLDADTILLRDWEELWGWKGAFAYRWSRLEKYNTAVLRLNKGSALGSFLFRTALKNGLDFHPMTVSRYTKDAVLEGLLLRLPDALFDSAWLNTEFYQRDRPPQPYFQE
jgi:WD repeat and SOF domain-containing protein 1